MAEQQRRRRRRSRRPRRGGRGGCARSCSSTVSACRARSGTVSASSSGPDTSWSSSTCAAPAGTRELRSEELSLARWADDLGAVLDALEIRRPVLVGHSLGASVALKLRARTPDDVRALVLIGRRPEPLEPRAAHARLRRADRVHGAGRPGWTEYWSKNPPFSARLARARPGDPRRVPGISCSRTTRPTTCASAVPSPSAESLADRLGEVDAAGARRRRRERRPHAARARPPARRRARERARRRAARRRAHGPARGTGGDGGGGAGRSSRRSWRAATGERACSAPTRPRETRGRGRSGTSMCAGWSARRPVRR